MDFLRVIQQIGGALDAQQVRYALIGGFAMALHGLQRATVDLDFILMLEDLNRTDQILTDAGYRRVFTSENVSHYLADSPDLGRIDLVHAFRGPSLSMLERAERIEITGDLGLPVVQVEDLIGLKIQAAVNDEQRAAADWVDIQLMIQAAALAGNSLDWSLIEDYLGIFGLNSELTRMRDWYGQTNGR
jgi:predicted nucleotidyltransferase